jgi:hypothetical protein
MNTSKIIPFLLILIFFISSCKQIEEIIPKPAVCGDNICEGKETSETCCIDCACPEKYFCEDNICKREAELREISYSDIEKSFKLIDEDDYSHNCNTNNQCFIQDSINILKITIDDPEFLPEELEMSFDIPLENLGDEELNNIQINAYVDNDNFLSKVLSLGSKERKSVKADISKTIDLGSESYSIRIDLETDKKRFSIDFDLDYTLLMAILKEISNEDIDYDISFELEIPHIGSDREQYTTTQNYPCTNELSCSSSFLGNTLDVNFEPYRHVVSSEFMITLPIENIGNKKFDSLRVSNPFYFDGFDSSQTISLDAGEKTNIYAKIEPSSSFRDSYEVRVYSDKQGYGKSTSMDFNIDYNFEPYFNLDCISKLYSYPKTIDYKNPTIKSLAESIIKKPANSGYAYDNVGELYKWVIQNTGTTGLEGTGSRKYASIVYEDEWGDCDDKSNLIVALARAVNVPPENIRVQCAVFCGLFEDDAECYENADVGHCWVDFDHDGKTYNLESRSIEQDFLTKWGLPLGIKAGHLFHKEWYLLLERPLNKYYYNDQYCVRQYP